MTRANLSTTNKDAITPYFFIACVILPLFAIPAYGFGSVSVTIAPNSTATETTYFYDDTTFLGLFLGYTDAKKGIVQDWYGTLYYDGVLNKTLPESILRYSMDYDYGEHDYVFQDAETNYTASGGWTASALLIDEDYDTSNTPAGSPGTLNVDYAKPDNVSYAVWDVKDGGGGRRNLTLPLACWAARDSVLNFQVYSGQAGTPTNWRCHNGTEYQTLSASTGNIFEEGVHWVNETLNRSVYTVMDRSLSFNLIDGMVENTANNATGCHAGNCTHFSDDGLINATSTALDNLANFTISMWIRPLSDGEIHFARVFEKGTATGIQRYGLMTVEGTADGVKLRFDMQNAGTIVKTITSDRIPINSEAHIVVTFDNSTMTADIYINGTEATYTDHQAGSDARPNDAGNTLFIGNIAPKTRGYNGSIDDFIVYDSLLTDAQIGSLYDGYLKTQNIAPGTYTGLVYYHDLITVKSDSDAETNVTRASLNVTVYDENTGEIVPTQLDVFVFNDDFTTNKTTSFGSAFFDDVPPGVMTIRYSNEYYDVRQQYYTVENVVETQEVTVYTGNASDAVTATVYDQNLNLIEDVNIRALRFDPIGGGYVEVDSEDTNFEGEAVLNLELNEELYKFILTYNGAVVLTTAETYVYSTAIDFQITIGEVPGEEFFTETDIISVLTFEVANDRFKWTYVNPNNGTIVACLETYRMTITDDEYLNVTCLTTDSGIIYSPVANINGTVYRVDAFIDYGYGYNLMDSLTHSFKQYAPFDDQTGIFYQAVITILFTCVAFWSLTFALVIVPLSLWLGYIIHLHTLNPAVMIGLQLVGIVALVILRRMR